MSGDWISVKDRLPPVDKPSLIMVDDNSVHVGYPDLLKCYDGKEYQRWIVGGWESCCYCGGQSIIGFEDRNCKIPIAWMPLPKPPENNAC